MMDSVLKMQEESPVVQGAIAWLEAHAYSSTEAVNVVSRLYAKPAVWLHFRELVEHGREPSNLVSHGITYEQLRLKMEPVNALLTFLWIEADPAEAIRALNYGIK